MFPAGPTKSRSETPVNRHYFFPRVHRDQNKTRSRPQRRTWHSAGWTICLTPVRWSTPSAHAMPDRRRSPHADRWATDPVQQPTPTTCPTGLGKIKEILEHWIDLGVDAFTLDYPGGYIGAGSGNLNYSDYTPDCIDLLAQKWRCRQTQRCKTENFEKCASSPETPTWWARDPQRGGDKIFAVRRLVLTWQLHRSPQVRMAWHQLSFPMSGSWRQIFDLCTISATTRDYPRVSKTEKSTSTAFYLVQFQEATLDDTAPEDPEMSRLLNRPFTQRMPRSPPLGDWIPVRIFGSLFINSSSCPHESEAA